MFISLVDFKQFKDKENLRQKKGFQALRNIFLIFAFKFIMTIKYTYPSNEKLKSRKQIQALFEGGKHVKTENLRLIYLPFDIEENVIKIGVSVSKRNFKLATDRNRVKRLMREVYRLNQYDLKNTLSKSYVMMLVYQSPKMPTFDSLNEQMQKIIVLFNNKLKS
jgi:ribonuclease P protein component